MVDIQITPGMLPQRKNYVNQRSEPGLCKISSNTWAPIQLPDVTSVPSTREVWRALWDQGKCASRPSIVCTWILVNHCHPKITAEENHRLFLFCFASILFFMWQGKSLYSKRVPIIKIITTGQKHVYVYQNGTHIQNFCSGCYLKNASTSASSCVVDGNKGLIPHCSSSDRVQPG
jgi:hypothetical protein